MRWIVVAVGAFVLAVPAVLLLVRRGQTAAERILLPPPPADAATAPNAFADFAGAEACAECHAPQYAAWSASTHGQAGGTPSPDVLMGAFDGRPIRFADATVTPRTVDGDFAFVVEQAGRAPVTLRIEGVTGGGHMVGGGTQGFFTRWGDGTLRFLPFELIRREGVWFCNTDTRLDEGWLPITPDRRLADCGDWPPVRVQGQIARYANCQQCHGSQIEVAPAPGRAHATRLASWAVNCESCHGPAQRHVTLMRERGATADARVAATGERASTAGVAPVSQLSRASVSADAATTDIGLRPLATLDTDASLDVCFSCHALKGAVRPGYLAGAELAAYYSLALPLLGDEPVFADGRIRTFAYQQGHLWSDCYLSGAMTCVDCHEPHGQGYRDVAGNPLPGRFDDGQCTGCHVSKADRVETHTKHAADSEGSRCVSCHMPYLQEPDVGDALVYARSDHTIPVPRPADDAALGIEVACAACHEDRDAEALQTDVERLWGALKPRPRIVDALLAHEPADGASATDALLESDPGRHRMALFQAIARWLVSGDVRVDAGIPSSVASRLRTLAHHEDDDVAAAALAALHYAAGEERDVRTFLAARLDSLGPRTAAVRRRWNIVLGSLGDRHRAAGEAAAAIRSYDKALEVRPNDAPTLLNLGLAHAQAGDVAAAIASYRRSLQSDPARALTHVNLGIALASAGDVAGAERAYREAIRVDAGEALAHFNLGNLYLRAGRSVEAILAYEAALAADPGMAPAWFNLARANAALGNIDTARDAVARGLEFAPGDAAGEAMRRDLESAGPEGRSGTQRR
jgi:tetratricopeptide (TPR) repeat protein